MLNLKNYGNTTTLVAAASNTTNTFKVADSDKFAVPAGDWFYATVKFNGTREFVKVMKAANGELTVVRAQDGSAANAFPKGACLEVEWNPQQLCEYIKTCSDCPQVTGVDGVFCIDCGSCLTIEHGKITAVNGEVKC